MITVPAAGRDFRAVDAVIALLFLFLLMVSLGLMHVEEAPVEVLMICSVAAYPLAALLAVTVRRKSIPDLLAPGRFSTPQLLFTILGSLGLTLILLSVIEPLLRLFPESEKALRELDAQFRSVPKGLAWLLIAVLAPVGEEIFFRAAMLRGFRSTLGTIAGLLVSSAVFAFFHGLAPRMIVTFLVGIWLGSLYLLGRGLGLSTIAHAFNNGVVLALMFGGVESVPPWWAAFGAVALITAWTALALSRRVQGSEPRHSS